MKDYEERERETEKDFLKTVVENLSILLEINKSRKARELSCTTSKVN